MGNLFVLLTFHENPSICRIEKITSYTREGWEPIAVDSSEIQELVAEFVHDNSEYMPEEDATVLVTLLPKHDYAFGVKQNYIVRER